MTTTSLADGAGAGDVPHALQHSGRVYDDDPVARSDGAANAVTVKPNDERVERRRLLGEPCPCVRCGGRRHARISIPLQLHS